MRIFHKVLRAGSPVRFSTAGATIAVATVGVLALSAIAGEEKTAARSADAAKSAVGAKATAKPGKPAAPATPAAPDIAQLDFSKIGEQPGDVTFAQICATCHGAKGEGNPALKSPSIAGMPAYYVVSQMDKFRAGLRGSLPDDVPGMQMRAIAMAVGEDGAKKVAAHVEELEKFPTVSTLGGEWKKGKVEYAERCMECHRFNGTGEIVFGSPPLISLPDWYLFEQMQDFRDDRRGAAATDIHGQKMRQACDGLEDSLFKDIVAYIGELAAGRQPRGSIWR